MFWMKLLKKLLKALNADVSPSEVAGGFVLGVFLGLSPTFSLHNLLIVTLIIILKVNISAAIFSALVFGIVGYAFDGLSHQLGRALLMSAPLEGVWSFFYNTPLLALARFHNTVVLGSVVISLILLMPMYIYGKKFVVYYRRDLSHKVEKMKIYKIVKSSKIYKFYMKVQKFKV